MIIILVFLFMETLNVLTLYFKPESKLGNGIGIFNALEKSKDDQAVYALIKYLINWVAGTKLIFIALLLVIVFTATDDTQLLAVIVLILSILSFYWRLYPMIKEMDHRGEISPKGYSKTLGLMIASFIVMFCLGILVYFITN